MALLKSATRPCTLTFQRPAVHHNGGAFEGSGKLEQRLHQEGRQGVFAAKRNERAQPQQPQQQQWQQRQPQQQDNSGVVFAGSGKLERQLHQEGRQGVFATNKEDSSQASADQNKQQHDAKGNNRRKRARARLKVKAMFRRS